MLNIDSILFNQNYLSQEFFGISFLTASIILSSIYYFTAKNEKLYRESERFLSISKVKSVKYNDGYNIIKTNNFNLYILEDRSLNLENILEISNKNKINLYTFIFNNSSIFGIDEKIKYDYNKKIAAIPEGEPMVYIMSNNKPKKLEEAFLYEDYKKLEIKGILNNKIYANSLKDNIDLYIENENNLMEELLKYINIKKELEIYKNIESRIIIFIPYHDYYLEKNNDETIMRITNIKDIIYTIIIDKTGTLGRDHINYLLYKPKDPHIF